MGSTARNQIEASISADSLLFDITDSKPAVEDARLASALRLGSEDAYELL